MPFEVNMSRVKSLGLMTPTHENSHNVLSAVFAVRENLSSKEAKGQSHKVNISLGLSVCLSVYRFLL